MVELRHFDLGESAIFSIRQLSFLGSIGMNDIKIFVRLLYDIGEIKV